jgi:hypothetical protein
MPKATITIDVTAQEIVEIIQGLAEIGIAKRYAKYTGRRTKVRNPRYKNVKKQMPKPMKRGQAWTKKETRWVRNYANSNPINKKIVKAYYTEFGLNRSFSSIANKAYALRSK